MSLLGALLAGATAGLASVPHCMGMCGPLAAASCMARRHAVWRYQFGRTISYVTAGLIAGAGGQMIFQLLHSHTTKSVIGWLVAIAFAYSAWRIWPRKKDWPVWFARSLPKSTSVNPPSSASRLAKIPHLVGLGSVLLPCGMLYAAFLLAASTGRPLGGGAVMAGFVTTSSLGLLAAGCAGRFVGREQRPWLLRLTSIALLGVAIFYVGKVTLH